MAPSTPKSSSAQDPRLCHITVPRTARFFLAGDLGESPREIWYVLHGYGQTADGFLDGFECIRRPDRWLVAPEGLSRFYTKGADGTVGASWMTRVDRELEIADTLSYLDLVRREVEQRARGIAGDDWEAATTLLGFSQGGAAACRWGLLGEGSVERIISFAGGLPPDLELATGDVLPELVFVVGTRDHFIGPERIESEEMRLREAGAAYRLLRFEGGHRLDEEVLLELARESG